MCIAGFFVETESFGGDGVKIRDASDKSMQKKKLYVNFCGSQLIEEPKDKNGKAVDVGRETADGLQIPLIIGKVRKFEDVGNVVDIIMSPKVMDLCNRQRYFKQQIIDLGLEWLAQETELKFDSKNTKEDANCLYKGGLGDTKDIPVLFHVDEDMMQPPEDKPATNSKPISKSKDKKEELLSSTKSLLAQLSKEAVEPEPVLMEAKLPFQQAEKSSKKPVIQEIGKNGKIEEVPPLKDSSATDKKSVKVSQHILSVFTS